MPTIFGRFPYAVALIGLLPRLALASIGVGRCRLIGRTIEELLFVMNFRARFILLALRE